MKVYYCKHCGIEIKKNKSSIGTKNIPRWYHYYKNGMYLYQCQLNAEPLDSSVKERTK